LIAFKDQSPSPLVGQGGETGQFNPRLAGCRLVMDDGLSQKIATIAGAGISMNALWSVHRELAEGSLVRVLPDHKVGDQTALWLIYPKSNVLTAKVRIFIDFLLEKTGNTPAWASA
jgi:DNA-binding transcriptional LysR family regulator